MRNKDLYVYIIKQNKCISRKKHPYDCFTNLSEEQSRPMTALWCPVFSSYLYDA